MSGIAEAIERRAVIDRSWSVDPYYTGAHNAYAMCASKTRHMASLAVIQGNRFLADRLHGEARHIASMARRNIDRVLGAAS